MTITSTNPSSGTVVEEGAVLTITSSVALQTLIYRREGYSDENIFVSGSGGWQAGYTGSSTGFAYTVRRNQGWDASPFQIVADDGATETTLEFYVVMAGEYPVHMRPWGSGGFGGTGTINKLDDIGDVNAPAPDDLDVLSFDDATQDWVPRPPGTPGPHNLESHSDVTLTAPQTDEVLTFNGSIWVNQEAQGGTTVGGSDDVPNDSSVTGATVTAALDQLDTDIGTNASAIANKTFASLTDTPASYVGYAGQYVAVTAGANGLEFVSLPPTSAQSLADVIEDTPVDNSVDMSTGAPIILIPQALLDNVFNVSYGPYGVSINANGIEFGNSDGGNKTYRIAAKGTTGAWVGTGISITGGDSTASSGGSVNINGGVGPTGYGTVNIGSSQTSTVTVGQGADQVLIGWTSADLGFVDSTGSTGSAGQVLISNGSYVAWGDVTPIGTSALDDLSDVNTGTPGAGQDGYVLSWVNGANQYQLLAPGAGTGTDFRPGLGVWGFDGTSTLGPGLSAGGFRVNDGSWVLVDTIFLHKTSAGGLLHASTIPSLENQQLVLSLDGGQSSTWNVGAIVDSGPYFTISVTLNSIVTTPAGGELTAFVPVPVQPSGGAEVNNLASAVTWTTIPINGTTGLGTAAQATVGNQTSGHVPALTGEGTLAITDSAGNTGTYYSDGILYDGAGGSNPTVTIKSGGYTTSTYSDSIEMVRDADNSKAGLYSAVAGTELYMDDKTRGSTANFRVDGITSTSPTFTIKGVDVVAPATKLAAVTTPVTAAAATLLDDASVGAMRTTLGLGGASVLNVGTTTGTVADGGAAYANTTAVSGLSSGKADKTIVLGAGTGLTGGGDLSANRSFAVNVGTGANQIVQLDGTAKLPAVDGSALLNVPGAVSTDEYNAIHDANTPSAANVFLTENDFGTVTAINSLLTDGPVAAFKTYADDTALQAALGVENQYGWRDSDKTLWRDDGAGTWEQVGVLADDVTIEIDSGTGKLQIKPSTIDDYVLKTVSGNVTWAAESAGFPGPDSGDKAGLDSAISDALILSNVGNEFTDAFLNDGLDAEKTTFAFNDRILVEDGTTGDKEYAQLGNVRGVYVQDDGGTAIGPFTTINFIDFLSVANGGGGTADVTAAPPGSGGGGAGNTVGIGQWTFSNSGTATPSAGVFTASAGATKATTYLYAHTNPVSPNVADHALKAFGSVRPGDGLLVQNVNNPGTDGAVYNVTAVLKVGSVFRFTVTNPPVTVGGTDFVYSDPDTLGLNQYSINVIRSGGPTITTSYSSSDTTTATGTLVSLSGGSILAGGNYKISFTGEVSHSVASATMTFTFDQTGPPTYTPEVLFTKVVTAPAAAGTHRSVAFNVVVTILDAQVNQSLKWVTSSGVGTLHSRELLIEKL